MDKIYKMIKQNPNSVELEEGRIKIENGHWSLVYNSLKKAVILKFIAISGRRIKMIIYPSHVTIKVQIDGAEWFRIRIKKITNISRLVSTLLKAQVELNEVLRDEGIYVE